MWSRPRACGGAQQLQDAILWSRLPLCCWRGMVERTESCAEGEEVLRGSGRGLWPGPEGSVHAGGVRLCRRHSSYLGVCGELKASK